MALPASFSPSYTYPRFAGPVFPTSTPTSLATGSQTLTVAHLLSALLILPNGGAAATFTLPTAALINAAIPGVAVGASFVFTIRNDDAADAITVAAGSGGTTSGTMTIAGVGVLKSFLVRVTSVKLSSDPAGVDSYTVYSLGSSAV